MCFCLVEVDISSAKALMNGIDLFCSLSGMKAKAGKYGLLQGQLPICYPGVPLITGKLSNRECLPLLNKFCSRIDNWTSKFLNFGGRLQLVKAVHCLWASLVTGVCLFSCSKSILKKLNAIMFKLIRGDFINLMGDAITKLVWKSAANP